MVRGTGARRAHRDLGTAGARRRRRQAAHARERLPRPTRPLPLGRTARRPHRTTRPAARRWRRRCTSSGRSLDCARRRAIQLWALAPAGGGWWRRRHHPFLREHGRRRRRRPHLSPFGNPLPGCQLWPLHACAAAHSAPAAWRRRRRRRPAVRSQHLRCCACRPRPLSHRRRRLRDRRPCTRRCEAAKSHRSAHCLHAACSRSRARPPARRRGRPTRPTGRRRGGGVARTGDARPGRRSPRRPSSAWRRRRRSARCRRPTLRERTASRARRAATPCPT